MTMDELKPKQSAYIRSVGGVGALRHHLLDMGLTPKTEVTLQKIAPMGDPVQIELGGYELTLRLDKAQKITVEKVHTKAAKTYGTQRIAAIEHLFIKMVDLNKIQRRMHRYYSYSRIPLHPYLSQYLRCLFLKRCNYKAPESSSLGSISMDVIK